MAQIDNLVIGITANAAGLTKELSRAQSEVNAFALKMQTSGNAPTAAIGNIIQNMPTALSGFKDMAGPIGAATVVLGAFMAMAKQTAEEFEKLTNKAEQFGMSVNDVKTFETMADSLSEDFFTGLNVFQKQVGAAAGGDKDMQKKFRDIGIDAEKIAKLPLAEQWGAVADHVAATGNRMDQVYIATEAFGKSGAKSLQFLQQGSQAFLEAQRELKRDGGWVSERDAEKMKALDKMFDKLGRLWGGIKMKTSGLLMEALDFMERMKTGGSISEPLAKAKQMSEATLAAAKAQRELSDEVSKTLDKFEEQAEFAGLNARAIEIEKMRRKGATEEQIAAMRRLAKEAHEAENREKQLDNAADLLNKLNEQINAFGLVGDEAEVFKMHMQGIPVEQLERITRQMRELRDLNMAQAIEREFVSPVDTFIDRMADLERLFEDGKIGLAQFAAAANAAFAKMPDLGKMPTSLPQALTAGSSEAISFMNKFNRQQEAAKEDNPAKKIEDLKKALEKKADEQVKKLEEIRRAIKNQNPIGEQGL